jgi:hypothetical protein
VQPVPITTKVVSLNPVHGEVYLIQHYVIKFASDLLQVGGFSLSTPVSSTNKTGGIFNYGIQMCKVLKSNIKNVTKIYSIIFICCHMFIKHNHCFL